MICWGQKEESEINLWSRWGGHIFCEAYVGGSEGGVGWVGGSEFSHQSS